MSPLAGVMAVVFSGAAADSRDRRAVLLLAKLLLAGSLAFLVVVSSAQLLTPTTLLLGLAAMGISNGISSPSWWTAVGSLVPPELVPIALQRRQLPVEHRTGGRTSARRRCLAKCGHERCSSRSAASSCSLSSSSFSCGGEGATFACPPGGRQPPRASSARCRRACAISRTLPASGRSPPARLCTSRRPPPSGRCCPCSPPGSCTPQLSATASSWQ